MRRVWDLIDPFAPAEGPPPDRLARFAPWALRGALPVIGFMLCVSILTGLTEVTAAFIVGWLVDAAEARGAAGFFAVMWPVLLAIAAFFLLLRPAVMGLGAALTALGLAPNLYPLVLARLNRHVLGQSLSYFDDDFAGRIAQKAQQTARAVADVVTEAVNTFGYALSAILGAAALMGAVDWRLAGLMALWVGGYVLLIRHFMPLVRARSKDRAGARAVVTGQIVDTISNIATVKLFAHGAFEDRAALGALSGSATPRSVSGALRRRSGSG